MHKCEVCKGTARYRIGGTIFDMFLNEEIHKQDSKYVCETCINRIGNSAHVEIAQIVQTEQVLS